MRGGRVRASRPWCIALAFLATACQGRDTPRTQAAAYCCHWWVPMTDLFFESAGVLSLVLLFDVVLPPYFVAAVASPRTVYRDRHAGYVQTFALLACWRLCV